MEQLIACAVTTCVRPGGVSYLARTLESLRAAKFETLCVVSDGPCEGAMRYSLCRLGIVPTFRTALSLVKDRMKLTGCRLAAIFQDDVLVPERLCRTLSLPGDRGIFSLYLSPERTADPGWSLLPNDGQYPLNIGGCGFLMDCDTARRLIDAPPFPRTDRLGSQLAMWARREQISFWLHSPSIVEHIGEVSCR